MHSFLRTFAPPPPCIRGRALPSPPLACSFGGRPRNSGPVVKPVQPASRFAAGAQSHDRQVRIEREPLGHEAPDAPVGPEGPDEERLARQERITERLAIAV